MSLCLGGTGQEMTPTWRIKCLFWQHFHKATICEKSPVQPSRLTQGPLIPKACLAKVKLSFFSVPSTPSNTTPHTHTPLWLPLPSPLPIQILPQSNWRYVWAKGVGEVVGRVTGGGVGGGWYSYSTRVGWLRCKCVPFINYQYRGPANEGTAGTKMAKPMAECLPSI